MVYDKVVKMDLLAFMNTKKCTYVHTYKFGSTDKRTYESTYQFGSTYMCTYERTYKFGSTNKRLYVRFLPWSPTSMEPFIGYMCDLMRARGCDHPIHSFKTVYQHRPNSIDVVV